MEAQSPYRRERWGRLPPYPRLGDKIPLEPPNKNNVLDERTLF